MSSTTTDVTFRSTRRRGASGPFDVRTAPQRAEPTDTGTRPFVDDLIATAALLLFSLAVAAGFARVFSGWDFFDDLALLALVGHGASLALRRARVPLLVAFPLLMALMFWLVAAMFYRDTFTLGLPNSTTYDLFRLDLDLVGERFRTEVAPVLFADGWDVLAAIGMACVVLLSDTFAFRAFARAEALVPGGVLFVFVAALGDDRSRIALSALLVAAGVVTTVVLRAHHSPERSATIGTAPRSIGLVVPVALVTGLVVAGLAGALGPRLPGADAEPIYETKGGNGGSVTEVVSPLVDIRSRLTDRTGTELFSVTATADAYWRSSALPQFDGQTWGLPERGLQRVDGQLGIAPAGSTEIRQQVVISGLGGVLVPAAADPIAASGTDELRFNPDTATLVNTGDSLAEGDVFEIVSAAPRYGPGQLAAATSLDPGDPIYFELPDDFPSSVTETARAVTDAAPTPYDKALALQNWMRSEFTYSLDVQEGHSTTAIEAFLERRVGYCEQFAGTYSAMLRSVGVPARVAVGFTPGTDDGLGNYSVLGRNAHAWPEVWFDGLGWVPFEPTPGRGAPGAEEYTGVAPQQDEQTEADQPDPAAAEIPTVQSTVPAPTLPDDATTPTTVADPNIPGFDLQDPAGSDAVSEEGASFPWTPILLVASVGLLLALPALVRAIRRRRSDDLGVEIARLWDRAVAAVADVGVPVGPDQTPTETAASTTRRFPTASRPMAALADSVTRSTYGPDGAALLSQEGTYGTDLIGNCSVWCRQIEKSVNDSLPVRARVRRYFTTLR